MNVFARTLATMWVVLPLLNKRSLNAKSVVCKKRRRRGWLKSYGFANNNDSSILALKTCYAKALKPWTNLMRQRRRSVRK